MLLKTSKASIKLDVKKSKRRAQSRCFGSLLKMHTTIGLGKGSPSWLQQHFKWTLQICNFSTTQKLVKAAFPIPQNYSLRVGIFRRICHMIYLHIQVKKHCPTTPVSHKWILGVPEIWMLPIQSGVSNHSCMPKSDVNAHPNLPNKHYRFLCMS